MRWCLLKAPIPFVVSISLLFAAAINTSAQSTASIEGQVIDQQGSVIPGVRLVAKSPAIGVERTATSDNRGRYQFPALPIGDYTIRAIATGFKQQVVERTIEVGTKITQDFDLQVGDVSEQVAISSTSDGIERSTMSVGHVVPRRMVQDLPLNGRYFLDLGLLVPGSVTPPQSAFWWQWPCNTHCPVCRASGNRQ